MKDSILSEKSFAFSLKIIEVYKILQGRHEYVLSKQLIRCATGIGANVMEASSALTKKEFIQKLSFASKEAKEAHYWLRLIHSSQLTDQGVTGLINDVEEIIKMLIASVKTAQRNELSMKKRPSSCPPTKS